jgi:uncharacterized damage-inducible protein DinB
MNLYGPKQLADSMRTVRKNTILIAEDIPEASYSYRPTPESRSVAETLLHIAALATIDQRIHEKERLVSLEGVSFGKLAEGLINAKRQYSKSEIISLLRSEGDRWCEWVQQIPESALAEPVRMPPGSNPGVKSRFEMLLGTKEHEIHHRAQIMVIERLLGIVPHLTRKRQAAEQLVAK